MSGKENSVGEGGGVEPTPTSQPHESTETAKVRKTVPIVIVHLKEAIDLRGKRGDGFSNPYALVSVSSRKGNWQQTATTFGTNNPQWNETFVFYSSREDLLQETATAAEYQKIVGRNSLFYRTAQSLCPTVKIQILSRPENKASSELTAPPISIEAEGSEDSVTNTKKTPDDSLEHKYSNRHRFLGQAEVDLTPYLDEALSRHDGPSTPLRRTSICLALEKRHRNSHVSGSVCIEIDVQMWNLKDITPQAIRGLYQASASSSSNNDITAAPNGNPQQTPRHLTSFLNSEIEALDDIAEVDQLCHKAKGCKLSNRTRSGDGSTKLRFRYLMVNIVKASQLAIKDTWKRSSDPFCRLQLGNLKAKTKTVQRDLNPIWNETFAFGLTEDDDWILRDLVVNVWDDDFGGVSSDFLGEVKIPIWILTTSSTHSLRYPKGSSSSSILSGTVSSTSAASNIGNSSSGDGLTQFLHWATGAKTGGGKSQNCECKASENARPEEQWLILEGRSRKSVVRGSICLRAWLVEEEDPELPSAKIISKTPASSEGNRSKKKSSYLPNSVAEDPQDQNGTDDSLGNRPAWRKKSTRGWLSSPDSARQVMVTPASLQRGGVYTEEDIQIIRLSMIGAKGLPKTDFSGKTDAYCKIILGNTEAKTSVQYRTYDPYWGEHFIFAVRKSDLSENSIRVEIWDHDPIHDEYIGHFLIPLNTIPYRYTFWKKNEKDYSLDDALKSLGRTSSIALNHGGAINEDFDKKLPIRCKPKRYIVNRDTYKGRNQEEQRAEVDLSCHIDLDAYLAESQQVQIAQIRVSVLSASNFLPKDSTVQGANTFCVLHHSTSWGHKEGAAWARTRTVNDNINPIWGETFTFNVMDPASVLTLALVDSSSSSMFNAKSVIVGLTRLRLSTLMPNRLYRGNFPMLRRGGSRGVESAGEVLLAVKLKVDDMKKYALSYSKPYLPAIVYLEESLVHKDVVARLQQGREDAVNRCLKDQNACIDPDVVHGILSDQQLFVHDLSMGVTRQKFLMRHAKAHVNRILGAGSKIQAFFLLSAISDILDWKRFWVSLLANAIFVFLVYFPYLIIPALLFSIFARGMMLFKDLNNQPDPFTPPLMDLTVSVGDSDSESDEEDSDIGPYKPDANDKTEVDAGAENAPLDSDVDVDAEDGESMKRTSSVGSNIDIYDTESQAGTVDGAFSSYIQLQNSSRRQGLKARLRKVNPVAIYKDIKAQLDSLKERARKVQNFLALVALNLERFQKLLSWHDPVGSGLFYMLLFIIGILFLLLGSKFIISALGLYLMRHPSLIDPLPPKPFNLFVRLPNRADQML